MIAAGAGFASATKISDLTGVADFRPQLQWLDGGPRLALIRIAAVDVPRALPPRDGVFLKNRFREHLGFAVT